MHVIDSTGKKAPYVNFSTQYRICKAEGLTGIGPMVTETAVRYYTTDGNCHRGPLEITAQSITCGRFGGICQSGNDGCVKHRNVFQPRQDFQTL